MKKTVYILLFIFLCTPLLADAYTFTRTLSIGSSGQDVKELQIYLNKNQSTQVSQTGTGSPGQESSYFGPKTKQALTTFQNLNAATILYPLGLTAGTGFFGQSTISFINANQQTNSVSLAPSNNQPVVTNSTNTQATSNILSAPVAPLNTPKFMVSLTTITPGTDLFVGSDTKLEPLDFMLDNEVLDKRCYTEYTCELDISRRLSSGIKILKSTDISLGSYKITVLDSDTRAPSTQIDKINLTGDNLITGRNFAQKVNVYTPFQVFTAQTVNDSFILNFEGTPTPSTATNGFLIIENTGGLRSDMILVQYEI